MTDEPDGRGPVDPEPHPDDAALRDAVAATRAELAALPIPELPPTVAARWAAALEAEALEAEADRHMSPRGDREPVSDRHMSPPGDRERGSDRHTGPRGGARTRRLLVAAALVAVAALGAVLHHPVPAPPTVSRVELVAVGRASIGTTDVGDLADAARRTACLRAVAPAVAEEALLGGRRVVLDGRPGVLLVLATGVRGQLRIITVEPTCGPAGGTLLAEVVAG